MERRQFIGLGLSERRTKFPSVKIFRVFLTFSIQEKYDSHQKLGSGKYSFVFEGFDILEKKEVILKVLKHSNMDKINREILTLNVIKGKSPHLANLINYGKEEMDGAIILVNLY